MLTILIYAIITYAVLWTISYIVVSNHEQKVAAENLYRNIEYPWLDTPLESGVGGFKIKLNHQILSVLAAGDVHTYGQLIYAVRNGMLTSIPGIKQTREDMIKIAMNEYQDNVMVGYCFGKHIPDKTVARYIADKMNIVDTTVHFDEFYDSPLYHAMGVNVGFAVRAYYEDLLWNTYHCNTSVWETYRGCSVL